MQYPYAVVKSKHTDIFTSADKAPSTNIDGDWGREPPGFR